MTSDVRCNGDANGMSIEAVCDWSRRNLVRRYILRESVRRMALWHAREIWDVQVTSTLSTRFTQ